METGRWASFPAFDTLSRGFAILLREPPRDGPLAPFFFGRLRWDSDPLKPDSKRYMKTKRPDGMGGRRVGISVPDVGTWLKNQWYNFGLGAPILIYFSGDGEVRAFEKSMAMWVWLKNGGPRWSPGKEKGRPKLDWISFLEFMWLQDVPS